MKIFDNISKNERGITLVELLAVLSILTIILSATFATFLLGVRSYERTAIEGQLRDESDIMITRIMNELYELSPQQVEPTPTNLNNQIESNNITFIRNTQKVINPDSGLVSQGDATEINKINIKVENSNLIITKTITDSTKPPAEQNKEIFSINLNSEKFYVEQSIKTNTNVPKPVFTIVPIEDGTHFIIKINFNLKFKNDSIRFDKNKVRELEIESKFSI